MIVSSPAIQLVVTSVIMLASTVSVVGAGNAPPLPGPYQSIFSNQPGVGYSQPQPSQQRQNTYVRVTPSPSQAIDTFPTHSFAMPYWMQASPQNIQPAPRNNWQNNNSQVNPASNFRPNQQVQNNLNTQNNAGWGYNTNFGGFFQQPPSASFPANGSGFAPNSFGANPNGNFAQGIQNNSAPARVNLPQGNFGPASNFGVQWNGFGNGFGNGQMVNPWSGVGYPSSNGFNNGQPNGAPNTVQR